MLHSPKIPSIWCRLKIFFSNLKSFWEILDYPSTLTPFVGIFQLFSLLNFTFDFSFTTAPGFEGADYQAESLLHLLKLYIYHQELVAALEGANKE